MSVNAQVQIVIDAANSAKTVGDLKKNMVELNKELDKVDKGSAEFFQLTEAMNDTRDALKLIKKEVGEPQLLKNFQSLANIGSAMASGFQVAQGALNLFGIESDAVQKAMVKLQAAMAISQGLQQLAVAFDTAKKASGALNASLLSNPYVLLAAAVVAAAIALYQFSKANDQAAKDAEMLKKQQEDLNNFLSENSSAIATQTKSLIELAGQYDDVTESYSKFNDQLDRSLEIIVKQAIFKAMSEDIDKLVGQIAKNSITINALNKEIDKNTTGYKANEQTIQSLNESLEVLKKEQNGLITTGVNTDNTYESNKESVLEYTAENQKLTTQLLELLNGASDVGKELEALGVNTKKAGAGATELSKIQSLFTDELKRFEDEYIQKRTQLNQNFLNGQFKTEQDYKLAQETLDGEQLNNRLDLIRKFGTIADQDTKLKNEERIQLLRDFNSQLIKIQSDETANEIDINKAKEAKIKNDIEIANLEKLNAIEKDYLVERQILITKAMNGEIKTEQELNYQLALLDIDRQDAELNTLVQGSNEYLAKKADIDKAKLDLERKHSEDILKEADRLNKETQAKFTKTISTIGSYAGIIGNTFKSLISAFTEFSRQESDQALAVVQQNTNDQIALAETQKQQGILSEREYQDKILSIRKDAAIKERKLKAEQWQKDKDAKIATAVIDTALAVVSALAAPFPVSIAASIAAGITGALQIGIIASQPAPAFAKGGRITGAGTGTSDSINARVSNGESIINAKSTSTYLPVLDFINQAGGGVPLMPKFASGGVMGAANSNTTGELLRAIRSIGGNQHIQVEAYLDPDKANRVFDERQRIKDRRNRG